MCNRISGKWRQGDWWLSSFWENYSLVLLRKFSMTFYHSAGRISMARRISSFSLGIILGLLAYAFSFKKPQKENSNCVKSHDLAGQFTSPRREITLPSNFVFNNSVVSFGVLQIAPACWNYISSRSISATWGQKKLFSKKNSPKTVARGGYVGRWSITFRFSAPVFV